MGGQANSKGGDASHYVTIFVQKTAWKWKLLDPEDEDQIQILQICQQTIACVSVESIEFIASGEK